MPELPSTPQQNEPEARTETGELKTQTPPTPPTQTSEPAPLDYSKLTLPEGVNKDSVKEATDLFKGLSIAPDIAQKLIDFQSKRDIATSAAGMKAVEDMRTQWRDEVSKDPEIGGKLDDVKAEVGKALTQLPPDLVRSFKETMDYTGVGDNPAFIKALYHLSQLVNEGKHVAGTPLTNEPNRPGAAPTSIAQRLYPNLPSASQQ